MLANLGATASGVALSSGAGALRSGTYAARNLLPGPDGTVLRVGADGRISGYIPAAALGTREYLVLDLVRR